MFYHSLRSIVDVPLCICKLCCIKDHTYLLTYQDKILYCDV